MLSNGSTSILLRQSIWSFGLLLPFHSLCYVPLYRNVSSFLSFSFRYLFRCTRPLQFVSGSVFFYDKNLCFRWPVPPLLRFHDLYISSVFTAVPLILTSLPIFSRSSGFIVFSYPYISIPIFPAYSLLICSAGFSVFPSFWSVFWFVPSSRYSDFEFTFNGPLVYTTFIMFYFISLSCFFIFDQGWTFIRSLPLTFLILFLLFWAFSYLPIGPYLSCPFLL